MRSIFHREVRDFTYVDDIVEGVTRVIDNPPVSAQNSKEARISPPSQGGVAPPTGGNGVVSAPDMGFSEFIRQIVLQEASAKKERSIQYRIRESRLPKPYKLLSDFDFSFQPGLKRKLIMDLATLDFIANKESILFIGDPGTGKSHIARALALIACQKCYKVYYTTCSDMLNDLNQGVYEKNLVERLKKYVNPQLLVIDEMGHDWNWRLPKRPICCLK